MGDIADMTLDGTLCQYCGQYIGEGDGIPRSCGCERDDDSPRIGESKSERHNRWRIENTEAIDKSGVPYRKSKDGRTFLFREKRMPMVDYYPSTGRYRILNDGKGSRAKSGGAKARRFLKWYLSIKERVERG